MYRYPNLDPRYSMLLLPLGIIGDPQHEVHHHGKQQHNSQQRRTESVVKASLSPHPYALRTPVIRHQGIYHGQHGHAGEEKRRDKGRSVAEVEHADGQGAEDDGEVEP